MNHRALYRTACCVLLPLLAGCAQSPAVPYDDDRIIEIVVRAGAAPSGDPEPSRAKSTAGGAAAGAFFGLMYSTVGSLVCGPFFAACFAATAPATVGGSALAGGIVGAAGIGQEDPEAMAPVMEALERDHAVGQELAAAVVRHLPGASTAPAKAPDIRLNLEGTRVRFSKSFGRQYGVQVLTTARFEWKLGEAEPGETSKIYFHSRPPRPLDEWLNDDGTLLAQDLGACLEEMSSAIAWTLRRSADEAGSDDVGFSQIPY